MEVVVPLPAVHTYGQFRVSGKEAGGPGENPHRQTRPTHGLSSGPSWGGSKNHALCLKYQSENNLQNVTCAVVAIKHINADSGCLTCCVSVCPAALSLTCYDTISFSDIPV